MSTIFPFRVRQSQHLNTSRAPGPSSVASRLHEAARRPSPARRVTVRGFSLRGAGPPSSSAPARADRHRHVADPGGCVGSGLLGEMQRMAELEEVDSALLSDDLPD